jgi:predicted Zn-dependent peptidase
MQVEQTRLSNGLLVITNSLPYLESAGFGVFVRAGSRQETEANNGVAHFLEHLMFKGTSTRSAYEISREIEILGSNVNAHTSQEMTTYHSSGLATNIGESVDIIGDALTDSLFRGDDIALERGVILQEIKRHEDSPSSVMYDALATISYPNQPIGRAILGSSDFVSNATEQDFRAFTDQHYTTDNMIISAAGGINHTAFVQRVERAFNLPALPQTANRPTLQPAHYAGGIQVDRSRDFKQVTAGIAFDSVSIHNEHYYHHAMLASAFGGGMSSPLMMEIREKRGLVYSTGCFNDASSDNGRIIITGGMTADNLEEFVRTACAEFRKMAETINPIDLTRAKNATLTWIATMRENAFSTAYYMANSFWNYGRVRDLSELRANVEAVTIDDLRTAAETVLRSKPSIALIGPVPEADYEAMVAKAIA